jgi:hypothetical protein
MKLNWNSRVSSFVAEKLDALRRAEHLGPLVDEGEVARTMNALPVYLDMGGALGFTPDGAVLLYDWQSEQVAPEHDEGWMIVAAVAAAEKYPELRAILPVKPPTATTCSHCSGRGKVSVTGSTTLSCGKCWGLGWVT